MESSSEDEFEDCFPNTRLRIANGLNLREIRDTGSTSFEITGQQMPMPNLADSEEEDDVEFSCGKKRKKPHEKFTPQQLQDELYKDFMAQDLSGLAAKLKQKEECSVDSTYEEISRFMESITEDGGIKKRVLLPGWGPVIKIGQVAYVHYVISYEKGDETMRYEQVVDATKVPERNSEPYRFKLGAGNVLPALELAVATMQVNESAQFLCTYKYAYGKLGLYREVPEETSVMIQILLVKVEDGSVKSNVWELDREDRKELPFEEQLNAVKELKTYGKDFYDKKDHSSAELKYKKALQLLNEILTPHKDETEKIVDLMYKLYINIGQCKILAKEWRRGKYYLKEALDLQLTDVQKLKAYYRLAICQAELGEISEARANIEKAKSFDVMNTDINTLYEKLHNKVLQDFEAEKEYSRRMFNNLKIND